MLSFSTVSAQIISLVTLTYVTRIYSQQEIGYYSVYMAYFTIINVISLLSYDLVIPKIEDKDSLGTLVVALNILAIFVSCIVYLVSKLFNYEFSLYLATITLFLSLTKIANLLNLRANKIRLLAGVKLSQPIAFLMCVYILPLLAEADTELLILSQLLSVVAVSVIYYIITNIGLIKINEYYVGKMNCHPVQMLKLLHRYKEFSVFVAPSAVFSSLTYNLPIIIIERFIGPVYAAQYSITQKFCQRPINMVGGIINNLYYGKLSETVRLKNKNGYRHFRQLNKGLVIMALMALFAIGVVLPLIIKLVLGDEWTLAAKMISILSPLFTLMLLVAPLGVVFFVFNEQRYVFYNQLVNLIISILVFGIAAYTNNLLVGVVMFSIFGTIRYLFIYRKILLVVNKNMTA